MVDGKIHRTGDDVPFPWWMLTLTNFTQCDRSQHAGNNRRLPTGQKTSLNEKSEDYSWVLMSTARHGVGN